MNRNLLRNSWFFPVEKVPIRTTVIRNGVEQDVLVPNKKALVAADSGEIETWGRGIQRIFEACREAGVPEPIIEYKPNDLWIEFPFAPVYLDIIQGKTSGKTSGKIVALMEANAHISIPELAEIIGVTERSIERGIRKLQQEKRIRRVGPAKGGHWQVTSSTSTKE